MPKWGRNEAIFIYLIHFSDRKYEFSIILSIHNNQIYLDHRPKTRIRPSTCRVPKFSFKKKSNNVGNNNHHKSTFWYQYSTMNQVTCPNGYEIQSQLSFRLNWLVGWKSSNEKEKLTRIESFFSNFLPFAVGQCRRCSSNLKVFLIQVQSFNSIHSMT